MAEPPWPHFGIHDVITTSYEVTNSRFSHHETSLDVLSPSKSHCHNCHSGEIMEDGGGGGGEWSPQAKRTKTPCLDRVKLYKKAINWSGNIENKISTISLEC